MKANELRMGNWLQQGRVIEIKENVSRVLYITNNESTSLVMYETLNPIPLTEEILLKCPIIKRAIDGYPYKFLNGFLRLRNGVFFFKYYDLEIELPYLHTFQNLYYALTNEELQINL